MSTSSSFSSSDSSYSSDSDDLPVRKIPQNSKPQPSSVKKSISMAKQIEEKVDLDSDSEYDYEANKNEDDDCACLSWLNDGPKLCQGWWVFKTTTIYHYSRQVDMKTADGGIWYAPLFFVALLESMIWLTYFMLLALTMPIWFAFSAVTFCLCCKVKGFKAWLQAGVSFPMNILLLPRIILRCCRRGRK